MRKYRVAILLLTAFMLLTACGRDYPRQGYLSLGQVGKRLDNRFILPEAYCESKGEDYGISYFLAKGGTANDAAGYIVELKRKDSGIYGSIELRGIDLASDGGLWTEFPEQSYTCVMEGTQEQAENQLITYAAYREYPFTREEFDGLLDEQKDIGQSLGKDDFSVLDDELQKTWFTVFHAFTDIGGIRYSITFWGINAQESEEAYDELLSSARGYFEVLLID